MVGWLFLSLLLKNDFAQIQSRPIINTMEILLNDINSDIYLDKYNVLCVKKNMKRNIKRFNSIWS